MVETITPEEARRRIAAGAALIDVRDPDEYARAHTPAPAISRSPACRGSRMRRK